MVQWWAIYVTVSIVCFSSATFRLSTHRMVPPVMGYAPIDRPAQVTGDENLGRRVVCACAAGRERSASHLTARRSCGGVDLALAALVLMQSPRLPPMQGSGDCAGYYMDYFKCVLMTPWAHTAMVRDLPSATHPPPAFPRPCVQMH